MSRSLTQLDGFRATYGFLVKFRCLRSADELSAASGQILVQLLPVDFNIALIVSQL